MKPQFQFQVYSKSVGRDITLDIYADRDLGALVLVPDLTTSATVTLPCPDGRLWLRRRWERAQKGRNSDNKAIP